MSISPIYIAEIPMVMRSIQLQVSRPSETHTPTMKLVKVLYKYCFLSEFGKLRITCCLFYKTRLGDFFTLDGVC